MSSEPTAKLRRIIKPLACVILVALPLTMWFLLHRSTQQGDIDESAWVFSSYYYHLAFQRGAWRHADWQKRDAYDHRPLAPWIFGAALALANGVETSPAKKLWWNDHAYDIYQGSTFIDELERRVSDRAILTIRTVAFIFGLLTLLMVYCIGRTLSPIVGVVAAFLLSCQPLLQYYSVLGMPDTQVLFWMSAAIALQLWLTQRLSDPTQSNARLCGWLCLLSLLLALGFLTKIGAVMGWICWVALCVTQCCAVKDPHLRYRFCGAGVATIVLAWVFVVALYPTLWPHPIGNFIELFRLRLNWVEMQRQFFFANTFTDWGRQFMYAVRQLFFEHAATYRAVRLPLELVFALLGALLLAREAGQQTTARPNGVCAQLIVLFSLVLIGAQTFVSFHLNWPRYLLPALPLVCVVAASGIVRAVEPFFSGGWAALREFHRPLTRQWALTMVMAGVAALVCVGPLQLPANSLTITERFLREQTNALHFHPHDKLVKATLAIVFLQSGDAKRAEGLWQEVNQPDPGEEILPISSELLAFFEAAGRRYPQLKPLQSWLAAARARFKLAAYRDCFYVSGRSQFLLGVSYYGGLGASDETLHADLDELKRLGFNWIRVWATWAASDNNVSAVNPDGSAREPHLSRLLALCTEAERRGLIVDVTLSRSKGVAGKGLLPDLTGHMRAVETLTEALRPYRNVYFDLANERNIRDSRFVSIAEIRQLRDRVKALDPYRLVTASHGSDITQDELRDDLEVAQLDFISPHRPRDRQSVLQTAGKTRELRNWMSEIGRVVPVHFQEPFRRGYGEWEPRAEDFLADLRAARESGAAGWCFHNGSERSAKDGRPRRSFDLSESEGRLLNQLDTVEREFLQNLSGLSLDTARSTRSVQSSPRQGRE